MIRPPVVAGRFYPDNPKTLRSDLERYTAPRAGGLAAKACLVPHAGYMYSGGVAGAVYAALDLPRLFVILAPNHARMEHQKNAPRTVTRLKTPKDMRAMPAGMEIK